MVTASLPTALPGRRYVVPGVVLGSVLLVAVLAAYVDALTTAAERDQAFAGRGALTALVGALVAAAAAAILTERPGHRIGFLLAGLGGLWAVDGLAESWSAYAIAHGLPGQDLAVWFVDRVGAFLLLGLPLLLVLYPSGRMMTGRWRTVSVLVVIAAASLPTALMVAPDAVVLAEDRPAGVRTDFLAIPMSEQVATGLLLTTRLLTLLALAAALMVVLVRHRHADGLERIQLRWLLWAGVVCLLSVAVVALVPTGDLPTVVFALAVTLTAASVAVGVVRPGLGDVDALVAATLTYAGVAAIVVGFDLLALAVAGSLLGDRLAERDVTLLVLIVAVAVYGPLRSWLGGGVRRLLFGRRGDRYDVVAGLAARLEETSTVDAQLAALVSALASTFKMRFVRVEVYLAAGGSVVATDGTVSEDAHQLDIEYRDERIGVVTLPRRGVGSMLSRRDQGLLVDLVRQAAIAIRSSLLADALQDSRERLVLGREEDRRRIRRDLHDGLGPTLGGVALRLDAAGNAINTDPARARELLGLAGTEVREALHEVRRLVHDLRPPALDDLGLVAALEQQAARVRTELHVEVRADGVETLPAAVEVAAYRIASEALANVVRHAGARRCQIALRVRERALEVEVSDDGRGIAEGVPAGVGLLSLRERADELGGHCEVTCPDSGGTRVLAWLPWAGPEGAR